MEKQKLRKKKEKAQRENNETVLINVCTDLANLYVEEGRHDLAIEEYKRVAGIYKKQKNQLEYATVNRGIGEAYLGLQNFEKALQHQKIYLDIAKELKNKLEEQRALATIGHTYLSRYLEMPESDKANLDLASRFFRKSLVVSQSLIGQVTKLEIADMSARLFSNLGLVQDCMGDFEAASELITKSINLCKANDLYEQLQRGHMSLASLLVKKGDHRSALQQYNLAAEAAKQLRNKPALLAGILLSKSEILVKLGDLQGAKNTLHRAYKLKIADAKDRKQIENNLRVVASMSYNEDKLLSTDSTDYVRLKGLYEKMGDGACDLRQYDKALEYYKKMLDSAIKAGLSGPDLGTCFYSLAETYKDNGQFQEAVLHFEQELESCQLLKDSLNTLSKIADTKETAEAAISDVQEVYNRAVELCQKENNVHEEGRMLKRLILYLRRQKQHSKAFELEQDLAKLNYQSSDSDAESSEPQTGSVVGADVDLDAITDVSDSDSEPEPISKTRRRTRNLQVRRNEKGETQLHTACIKGQLNVVSHLLEQGHPVNVRDNAGWLPLHEACIKGHLQAVELLLEKGAAINDRGGTQCEGITPLHDAASNGHLTIVRLLIDRGANAVAKTDNGETVLDFLKKWRSGKNLNDEDQVVYDSIEQQVSRDLDKVGHVTARRDDVGDVATPTKDMRRSAIIGLEDEDSASPPPSTSTAHDYLDVMESLRHRNTIQIKDHSRRVSLTKRSALLSAEDVADDWLDDDVGKTVKKRKTGSPHAYNTRNSPVKSRKSEEFVIINDDVTMMCDDDSTNSSTRSSPNPKKTSRKRQAKLTSFGHTRTFVEPDSTSSPGGKAPAAKTPTKTFPRTHSLERAQPIIEPTLSVDVRINKKLYRVPVLLSQVGTLTIKWLADEAAARYARKEYTVPTLELETKNGAILADDDPISLLFPMGATQSEEVEGRIVKWSVPPLTDRYREACQDMSVVPHDAICRILQEFSVTLDFSNRGLKGPNLSPLCKVLNRQTNLIELNLSGNFLTNECFQFLGSSMPSLENLCRLSLNCTGLRTEHAETVFGNLSPDVAYKITDVDLGDNLLTDHCLESLAVVSRRCQLKKINLSGNKFSGALLGQNLTLDLSHVQSFDVSDNDLSSDVLSKMLSWLSFPVLQDLNISRTSATGGVLKEAFNNSNQAGELKVCQLSRCHVTDSEVFDLLRVAPSLVTLDLSYNSDLTSISLRRLLQSEIRNLVVYGCDNILRYFTDFARYLDEASSDREKSKTLKISLPENCDTEKEYLINMWKDMYDDRTSIELNTRFLCLSLSK